MESDTHIFKDCELAMHIWKASNLGIHAKKSRECTVATWSRNQFWFFMQKDHHGEQYVVEFIATLWSIWTYMNKIVFNQDTQIHPSSIMEQIKLWKGRWQQTHGTKTDKEGGKINTCDNLLFSNHALTYEENWKKEHR